MAPKTIAVIGAMFVELLMVSSRHPDPGESLLGDEYYDGPGGKGCNAAVAAYRSCHTKPEEPAKPAEPAEPADQVTDDTTTAAANAQVDHEFNIRMIGAIGNDDYGKVVTKALRDNGVDDTGVRVDDSLSTGVAFCMVEEKTRDNRCLFTRGATTSWKTSDFMKAEDLGQGVKPDLCVAQMEIHPDVVQQMIRTAGESGIDFVLNAAPAEPLQYDVYRHVTHLIVNETEAALLFGLPPQDVNEKTWEKICEDFLERGVGNVVITLSAKGAYYLNSHKRGHARGYKVDVQDTTGAGDTFVAAYSCDYLKQIAVDKANWDIEKAVVRANKAAAMTVTRLGSQAGIPWSNETDVFDRPFNEPGLLEGEADVDTLKMVTEPIEETSGGS